jgi:SAM-dependent methyltransferase
VEYRVARAEESALESASIDLIMVAQALHWFDLDRFYDEVRRVLKKNSVLAASVYNLLHIEPAIDEVINRYYYEVVGTFWPPERVLIEKFEELPLLFSEIQTPSFEMIGQWNLEHLVGYLRSWSATQRFIAENQRDPLEDIADELRGAWGNPQQARSVIWPLTLRVGVKTQGAAVSSPPTKKRRTLNVQRPMQKKQAMSRLRSI